MPVSQRLLGRICHIALLVFAGCAWSAEPESGKPEDPAVRARLQLQDVIASWASAWQSQFDDVYLMHYHPSFQPEGFKSVEDWQASRRNKVKEPDTIDLSLEGFELVELTQDTALVRFWLDYSRPGYADRTRKEMRLRLEHEIWMIEREHNMEVVRQSLDQDAPTVVQASHRKKPESPAKAGSDAVVRPSAATADLLQAVVLTWVSAWQSQLIDKYLAYYHPAFKPEGAESLQEWKLERRARLLGSALITISVRMFELVQLSGDTAEVRFWLDYSRPGYADSTHKQLDLRREGQNWMIVREHNLQVTKPSP